MLCKMRQSAKEIIDLYIFDGNPLNFHYSKYAAGKMKDLIINFVQRKKLYGDSHRVIAAYRKRIKQWPQIKHGDAKGYRGF